MIVVAQVAPTPPLPPAPAAGEPLSASLSVGLTVTEKTRVAAAAKAAGLSMSAWVRALVVAGLGGT